MSDTQKTVIQDTLFKELITSTLKQPKKPLLDISLETARNPAPQVAAGIKISDTKPVKNTQAAEFPKEAQLNLLGIKLGYTETPQSPAHVHHGLNVENPPTIRSTQALLRF